MNKLRGYNSFKMTNYQVNSYQLHLLKFAKIMKQLAKHVLYKRAQLAYTNMIASQAKDLINCIKHNYRI